jgi:hypothetical protein
VRLLSGVDAEMTPMQPIRSGRCGAAAPMTVRSIGRAPRVQLSPPLPLTCAMIKALHGWLGSSVQPTAMATLGRPVERLSGISSYQCRNQIGDPATAGDLSEHALVNAIDIATFVLIGGATVDVRRHWGSTRRDPAPPATGSAAGSSRPDGAERPERRFLKAVHAGACKIFGTTIGPESNEAHRDHLHLDMAPIEDAEDRSCE